MTWARLEDDFYDHPNFAELDLDELGLWACMVAYCNRHLTDGFVPDTAIRKMGARGNGLRVATKLAAKRVPERVSTLARSHVDPSSTPSRAILDRVSNGFRIVGYLDHNPSRDEVVAKIDADRERKRAAGIAGGLASGRTRSRNSSTPPPPTRSTLLQENEADAKQPASSFRSEDQADVERNPKPDPLLSSPLLDTPLPPEGVGVVEEPRESGTFATGVVDRMHVVDVASCWAAGVRDVTGACLTPTGNHAVMVAELVRQSTASSAEHLEFARADGQRFARSNEPRFGFTPQRYAGWVAAGRVDARAPAGPVKAEKPVEYHGRKASFGD